MRVELRELGIGARLMGIVLLGAVLPLMLVGVWLVRDAPHAGEAVLEARMEEALRGLAGDVGLEWLRYRSILLDAAEAPAVATLLADASSIPEGEGVLFPFPTHPFPLPPELASVVREVSLTDVHGRPVAGSQFEDARLDGLPFRLPIHAPSGQMRGTVHGSLRLEALLARSAEWTARTGGVLGAFEAGGGRPVLATPLRPALLREARFQVEGEEWITRRHELSEPRVTLALAAPVDPFTDPFRQAAGRGVLLILAVAVTGFGAVVLLTHQTTRPLGALVEASDAVAGGELDRRVPVEGPREVRRLSRSFNRMSHRLSDTLDSLARREALAAVGELAASLAHEIRNPLTAIRLDLQRLEEVADDADRRARITERTLEAVARLERSVEGTLRVAGAGRIRPAPLELSPVIREAARLAAPTLERHGVELNLPASSGPRVMGDADALSQVVLNLLLNAAVVVDDAPRKQVRVTVAELDSGVEIAVHDTGRGIPPGELDRIFEPLHSTRPGGTGLGLTVVERIVQAHGGQVTVESTLGSGTTVRVLLPAAPGSSLSTGEVT